MVIADQGTAYYGAADLTLPGGAQLIGQPLWASAGGPPRPRSAPRSAHRTGG